MAEGEQRSGQLDRLVGEVAALRKALPPSPSREITSRQSAAIDGALARIAAMEAAVGELGAAAKSSTIFFDRRASHTWSNLGAP